MKFFFAQVSAWCAVLAVMLHPAFLALAVFAGFATLDTILRDLPDRS